MTQDPAKSALNVEESLMLSRWVLAPADQDKTEQIMRKHDLPEIVARLLVVREVPADKVDEFLNPRLADHFPDPLSLQDMKSLADHLAQAIIEGRGIGVFGDFDVDGATSTAILVRFFRYLGLDVPFYIPDRLAEDRQRSLDWSGAALA